MKRMVVHGDFALFEHVGGLHLVRISDGCTLQTWQRPLPTNGGIHRSPNCLTFDRAVLNYVFDRERGRLALLWGSGSIDRDGEISPNQYKHGVEIVDVPTQKSIQAKDPAPLLDSLLAFAPDGRLYAEGESTGLASFSAFPSDDPMLELMRNASGSKRSFDVRAGELCHALGFHALPHPQHLLFGAGGRVLSSSWSQFKPHLALLNVLGPPEVLHQECIEAGEVFALRGGVLGAEEAPTGLPLEEILVVEGVECMGARRVAVWGIEGASYSREQRLVRRRDLFLLEDPSDHAFVLHVSLEPSGTQAVLAMSDGSVISLDVAIGKATRFARNVSGGVSDEDTTKRIAIDFRFGFVAVLVAGGTQLFDFDGRNRGALGQANGVVEHAGRIYVLDGADVSRIDREGRRTAIGSAKSHVIGAGSCSDGILLVDDAGEVIVLAVP